MTRSDQGYRPPSRRPGPVAGFAALIACALPGIAVAEETPADLGTVVFSANRSATEEAAVGSSVTVIGRSEIEKSGETTVKDLLARVPGLSFSQMGAAGSTTTIEMRGLGAGYILIRVDGIDVSDPSQIQTAPSIEHLMLGDVERIEVLRGSQSALYGGTAVAGVIDITTRGASEKGVHHSLTVGGGSYGTASARYGFTAANDAVDVSTSIERFRTAGFSSADERYGNREKDGYDNTTASASVRYRVNDAFRLFGALRYARTQTNYDGSDPTSYYPVDETGPRYHSDRAEVGVRGGAEFDLIDGRLKNTVALQHYIMSRDAYDAYPAHFEGRRTKFEYLGNLALTESVGLSVGFDHAHETADTSAGVDEGIDNTGVFGQASWKPIAGLTLTGAIRDDHHSTFGDHPTHRFTAAWDVTDTTKLRSSWGTGFRPPSLYELYDPWYGNRALKPEQSRSFDVGIDQRFWDGRAQVSATWFHIDTDNLIQWVSTGYWSGAYSQVDGTSKRQGVELSGKLRVRDDLTLDAGYTYTDAVDSKDARLLRIPRQKVTAGADWAAWEKTNLTLRGTWVEDSVDTDYRVGSVRRLPDYFLLDGGIRWSWTDRVTISLTGKNLLDRKYETVWGYGTPGRTVYAALSLRY